MEFHYKFISNYYIKWLHLTFKESKIVSEYISKMFFYLCENDS